ncbi:MAG: SNF2 helicase associated domain-containing protein [Bacilli bacterium]|nr:SNF2 helicase associated domain-containing protein [Bacilli bacterium]
MNYIREIINLIGHDSLMKGRSYPSEYIKHIKTKFEDGKYIHNYEVESQSTINTYNIEIINNGGKIYSVKCNCPQFINKNTCKHLGAVFFEDIDRIYEHEHIDSTFISREILDYFCDNEDYNIKTKLNLEVEFTINETNVTLKLLIGDTKLYTLSQEAKLIDFMYAFKNKKEYTFGKQFVYNAKKHYFDTIDIDILNHINAYEKNTGYYYHTNPFHLSFREFESFIKIFKDKKITVNNTKIDEIVYELPTKYILNKKDTYQLYIDEYDKYIYLNNTNKYILYNNTLCIPNDNDIRFLTQLKNNKMDKLIFNDNDINKFSKGLLGKIKNNIEIDDNVSLKLPIKPKVNLYFDINDILTCKLILDYKDISINYFDNIDILRDNEYEDNIIKDLINNGLYIKNNQFIIENEDEMYDFISDKINTLSKSYNIYTSQKIDNTKILKNTNSSNNFNLGSSILEYNFSIEGIDTKEFNNIYKSLKRNKRYYKLNNNTIIKLEGNEGLKTINNIIDDLEINYNDIKNGSIALPKYQALYIDSLKKNKYKINTNNLFDKFIDNFKKYKDTNIVFDKNDDILRDYQIEGVKWLYTIYKCGFGGILADEMGLGKSIQAISFIRKIIKENKDAKIMIVSPTSLVYNWEKEFNKFGSDLNYIVVMDNKNKRKEILNNKDNYNIFITTYGLIRNDNDEYENIDFEVCIIDEAQTIKNYQSNMSREVKKIKSKCKIALTGTPLENNVIELWSIFDFIMPGYLNNLPKFKDKYNIKDITNDELKVLKDLNYLITPFILRRKKIDVLKSLPDKIVSEIYVELPDKQKLLYLKELDNTKN